jgi:membrane-associated phospholipid phosphatase
MRISRRWVSALLSMFALAAIAGGAATAFGQTSEMGSLGGQVTSDFKYTLDNMQMDAVDIATSPLYVASPNSVLRSPKFYLAVAGVGAAWGGAFALDQTIRARLRDMNSHTADNLAYASYAVTAGGTVMLYGYGLYAGDARARHYAITAGEAAGVATLLDEFVIKYAFGRLRPRQDGHSHTRFFDGGKSFVSGEVTPIFALAAGVSEYFDNKWYIALPVYAGAMADGFSRMGHDAHWFSDVVGAAMLGWGTTELLIYLHREHLAEPDRWRIFPVSAPEPAAQGAVGAPAGLGLKYSW